MILHINHKAFVLLLLITFPAGTFSWEKEEHRFLADLVFDSTLSFCGITFTDSEIVFPGKTGSTTINKMLWNNKSFGDISAFFSGDDISQSRCQTRGHTIMQQLRMLSAEFIDKVWSGIKQTPGDIQSIEVSNQNAVFNYLLYHLIALRFAKLSGNEGIDSYEALRYALIYEAVAQSYLSDSFSAGHLLLLNTDFMTFLNRKNIQITHDYYSSEGVYVINSQGDCWQAFGDRLLQWHPSSFSQVFDACFISLLELFLVYYVSLKKIEMPESLDRWAKSVSYEITLEELADRWVTANDGDKYYSEIKLSALLHIPMPVAAAWSVRTDTRDMYDIYQRKNYTQLREEKYHDPDLNEIDIGFLYSRNSMPGWMIPQFLPNDTLQNLIRYHPNVASVRYVQNRYLPPSYEGFLLIAGGTVILSKGKNKFGTSLGAGWGFLDEFLFIVKPSISVSAMHLFDDNKNWLLMADIGSGVNIPDLGIFNPRVDFGFAMGFQSPYNRGAVKFALGLDSETLPLGFTYAGLTFRLKSQFIFFNKTLYSQAMEIILH